MVRRATLLRSAAQLPRRRLQLASVSPAVAARFVSSLGGGGRIQDGVELSLEGRGGVNREWENGSAGGLGYYSIVLIIEN